MTLRERIERLKFYGTGDEAYELFQHTCYLCYRMHGEGPDDWANTLCEWAEVMAKESFEFQSTECPDEMDDFEMGRFG
jgi:hypothetical protein